MRILEIALSLLAVSTPAVAQNRREPEDVRRVSYAGSAPQARLFSQWGELSTATPARNGTEHFVIGTAEGQFTQLRIDLDSGCVIVTRIRVVYTDGTVQTSNARHLLGTQPFTTLELLGTKPIDWIEVTTATGTTGSYALHGLRLRSA